MVRAVVLLAVALSACANPHGGPAGSCSQPGDATCLDTATIRVCQGGQWLEAPCRGTQGCYLELDKVYCDQSGDEDGDACLAQYEGAAMCSMYEIDQALTCKSGRWVLTVCSTACVSLGSTSVACPTS